MSEMTYPEMEKRLNEILSQIKEEGVDIDKTTTLYQDGLKLLEKMEKYLKDLQEKVAKESD